MSVLINGDTIGTAENTLRADSLCVGETIAAIDLDWEAPTDFEVGETTMNINVVIPLSQQRILDAHHIWRGWTKKSASDHFFHVAMTWCDDSEHEEAGILVRDCGMYGFKHFMADKPPIMFDDNDSLKLRKDVNRPTPENREWICLSLRHREMDT